MGVYYPDMEIPKSCSRCPFTFICKELPKVMKIDYAEGLRNKRHPDCKLIEIDNDSLAQLVEH